MFRGAAFQVDLKPELRGTAASAYSCVSVFADQTGIMTVTVWRFDGSTTGGSGTEQAEQHVEAQLPPGTEAIDDLTDQAWWATSRCLLGARSRNLLFQFEAKPIDDSKPVPDCRSRVEPLARGYLELAI